MLPKCYPNMAKTRAKLTKRKLDAFLREREGLGKSEARLWDSEIPGFHVRTRGSGKLTYRFIYREEGTRRQRVVNLGRYPGLAPAQAREAAAKCFAKVTQGISPAAERDSRRGAPMASRTVLEAARAFVAENQQIKPSTRDIYLHLIKRHVEPSPVGRLRAGDVTPAIARKFHAGIGGKVGADGKAKGQGTTANRVIQLLRAVWNWHDSGAANPWKTDRRRFRAYKEERRERVPTAKELKAIDEELREGPRRGEKRPGWIAPHVAACIRLVAATGMRVSEAASLTWGEVVLSEGRIHKAATKKGQRNYPLGERAEAVLQGIYRPDADADDLVFPTANGKAMGNRQLSRAWKRVAERLGVYDGADGKFTLHTFRHGRVSAAVAAGFGSEAGLLVAHRSADATARYTHHTARRARELATAVDRSQMAGK